jgi:hypothetical protein
MGILLTFKNKRRRETKRVRLQTLTHLQVALDNLEIKMALHLGDGDLSLGIRRALVLGSMRQFETLTGKSSTLPADKIPPLG